MLHLHAALKNWAEKHRKTGAKRWGGMVGNALRKVANKQAPPGTPMADFTPETEVTKEVCFCFAASCCVMLCSSPPAACPFLWLWTIILAQWASFRDGNVAALLQAQLSVSSVLRFG